MTAKHLNTGVFQAEAGLKSQIFLIIPSKYATLFICADQTGFFYGYWPNKNGNDAKKKKSFFKKKDKEMTWKVSQFLILMEQKKKNNYTQQKEQIKK